jgi:hypothetical protein
MFRDRSRGSSVGIATGCGLDGQDSVLDKGNRLNSPPQRPDRLWSTPSLLSSGYWGFFPRGLKRQGREADHLCPYSAEVKNGGGAIPPRCLITDKNNNVCTYCYDRGFEMKYILRLAQGVRKVIAGFRESVFRELTEVFKEIIFNLKRTANSVERDH